MDNIWRVAEKKKKTLWKLKCQLNRPGTPRKKNGIIKSRSCAAEATAEFKNDCVVFEILHQHQHSLGVCDLLKRNSMVLKWIKEEARRGHDAKAILSWVKRKMLKYDYLGLKYISTSYVRSVAKKYGGLDFVNSDVSRNTIEFFINNGFTVFHKRIECGRVIGFVNSRQVEMLKTIGSNLVVMDSCEKTNSSGYNLVSVVARTNERIWVPLLQFWISSENSLLYSECFLWIVQATENSWKPKAFVIDGSTIEEKAIVDVFGSNTKVYNCTRHSLQTLITKVGHIDIVLECMNRTLFASSRLECEKNLNLAISYCGETQ